MSAKKLARLEKELGRAHAEGVNIRVSKGTRLYDDVKRMLRQRHHVSDLKGAALL